MSEPTAEDKFRELLTKLAQVPKVEADRLEVERPKKRKRKKPAA